MTMGMWVAVVGVLLAMLTETLVFWRRRVLLKAKEQCFRFHDLRDRLQMLAVEHKVEPTSRVHDFLLYVINIAIRNAGVIKLSQILNISQTVKKEAAGGSEFEQLQAEIRSYPKDVQALASQVFSSFAWMLVANDDITVWLFKGLSVLTKITNEAAVRCIKSLISKIVPKRVQVVYEANDYNRFGQRLAPSY